jgi:hypothetical protein
MTEYRTAKGWLTLDEREALFAAAGFGNVILNVGIEYGASIHCLKAGNPNAYIIAIDLIGDEKFEGDRDRIQFIKGDSTLLVLENGVDVTFIDGGHDYETVKADIAQFAPITRELILFHDYSELPMHAGVKKALDEWQTKEWKKVDQVDTISVYRRMR